MPTWKLRLPTNLVVQLETFNLVLIYCFMPAQLSCLTYLCQALLLWFKQEKSIPIYILEKCWIKIVIDYWGQVPWCKDPKALLRQIYRVPLTYHGTNIEKSFGFPWKWGLRSKTSVNHVSIWLYVVKCGLSASLVVPRYQWASLVRSHHPESKERLLLRLIYRKVGSTMIDHVLDVEGLHHLFLFLTPNSMSTTASSQLIYPCMQPMRCF